MSLKEGYFSTSCEEFTRGQSWTPIYTIVILGLSCHVLKATQAMGRATQSRRGSPHAKKLARRVEQKPCLPWHAKGNAVLPVSDMNSLSDPITYIITRPTKDLCFFKPSKIGRAVTPPTMVPAGPNTKSPTKGGEASAALTITAAVTFRRSAFSPIFARCSVLPGKFLQQLVEAPL